MSYNGWTNYETWDVALWFNNDMGMYAALSDYVHCCKSHNKTPNYYDMCAWLDFNDEDTTPDGVPYLSDKVNGKELSDSLFDI